MKIIEQFQNRLYHTYTVYYAFSRVFSTKDINQIIDTLCENGITIKDLRLSNSDEQPDHFFRLYPSLKDFSIFYSYDTNNHFIDDFGLTCICSNKTFRLTFEIGTNQVRTTTNGDIDLEPLLTKLENIS